jgi:putative FmdB family regulatory protein
MPTYDYQCDACDHKFELYQGINDPKKKKCPECGRLKLRRLLGTGAAVVFKGSGFYQTDYRSDSYHKAKAADKPSDSKSADSKSSGSDSKSGSSDAKAGGAKSKSGGSNSGSSSGSNSSSKTKSE